MKINSPIPFYLQEAPWSCTVACVRMVLAAYGKRFSREADLYVCCQTTIAGTLADDVVNCVQRYGFMGQHLKHCSIETMSQWLNQTLYPIALINLFPLTVQWSRHAVVVIGITDTHIHYLDPARGARMDDRTAFIQAWSMNSSRVILIE